jgi:two-component system, NarL family, sensor histidine kinase UhpB
MSRPGLLDIDREIEVYRIVQEALGNAMRHAEAVSIWLSVDGEAGGLAVRVGDDGRGFDLPAGDHAGLGLAGMRERALVLGADLQVKSTVGRGTLIELHVPWSDAGVNQVGSSARVASPVA